MRSATAHHSSAPRGGGGGRENGWAAHAYSGSVHDVDPSRRATRPRGLAHASRLFRSRQVRRPRSCRDDLHRSDTAQRDHGAECHSGVRRSGFLDRRHSWARAGNLDGVRWLHRGERRLHGFGNGRNLRGPRGLSGWWLRRLCGGHGRFRCCSSTSATAASPRLAGCHPGERDARSGREPELSERRDNGRIRSRVR